MAVADIVQFQKTLPEVKSALVVLSQNPSFDAVAAGLAFSLALGKSSISAVVCGPTPMIVEFNRLVGVDKIREDLGDNNLVITFTDYPPDDIEKVTCGIEGDTFTLVALPKPGCRAPRKDQVNLSFSGVGADLVVVVGVNYPDGLGKFAQKKDIFEKGNLALLGNSPLSGWRSSIELIDPSAGSISEVVFDVLEQSGLSIDEDIATNLFLGIEAGTRNFTSHQVKAETFEKVSKLLRRGAHRAPVKQQPFPPQRPSPRGQSFPGPFQDSRTFKGPTLP